MKAAQGSRRAGGRSEATRIVELALRMIAAGYIAAAAPSFADALPPIAGERSSARIEVARSSNPFAAPVGHQVARSGALLGRYDGILVRAPLGAAARLNVLGGFPVDTSSDDRTSGERAFYALSLDLPALGNGLTGQIFAMRQRARATDRDSVGGALGIDREHGFGFAAADYDLESRELGMAMLVAIARLDDRTTLKACADVRRNNAPSVNEATQGKSVASVDQLLDALSQAEIRNAALDRGLERRTFTLGAARQLAPDVQLAGDITLHTRQARKDSDGELTYALTATWRGRSQPVGHAVAAFQRIDGVASSSYLGSLGGYYPLSESLGIGPDLALERRRAARTDWTYRPSLRLQYLAAPLRLDLRLGLELGAAARGGERRGPRYFYSIGYQGQF